MCVNLEQNINLQSKRHNRSGEREVQGEKEKKTERKKRSKRKQEQEGKRKGEEKEGKTTLCDHLPIVLLILLPLPGLYATSLTGSIISNFQDMQCFRDNNYYISNNNASCCILPPLVKFQILESLVHSNDIA